MHKVPGSIPGGSIFCELTFFIN
ncbi:Uncharacterized protein CTYZ_00000555 [Cryptosporidium tyzzeri]|nr:Uncharacterized protein CTYZ_00000555 [Cryptosporidium tyzzeri]